MCDESKAIQMAILVTVRHIIFQISIAEHQPTIWIRQHHQSNWMPVFNVN